VQFIATAVAIREQGPSIVEKSVQLDEELRSKLISMKSEERIQFIKSNYESCSALSALFDAYPPPTSNATNSGSEKLTPKQSSHVNNNTKETKKTRSFSAVITCSLHGNHVNIYPCFDGTDLKITKNGRPSVYKLHNINAAGTMTHDGLHVSLPESFSIVAQNSDDHMVLGVQILNDSGKIVYEDQQGKWGVINVGN
jgi:hypothetical protein